MNCVVQEISGKYYEIYIICEYIKRIKSWNFVDFLRFLKFLGMVSKNISRNKLLRTF